MKKSVLAIVVAFLAVNASLGQSTRRSIGKKSSKELPADLKTETILFLKFDSVDLPEKRPKSYDKAKYIMWRNFNERVPEYNEILRAAAKKYPYKYKIVSMTDTAAYTTYGAKYLFWMNSFDAFTEGVTYSSGHWGSSLRGGHAVQTYYSSDNGGTELGIIDLTSSKTYLINGILGLSRTYKYDAMIGMLNRKIKQQSK